MELRIPKLRKGTFFASILERWRRIDRALFAVVMEAYVNGVVVRREFEFPRAGRPPVQGRPENVPTG